MIGLVETNMNLVTLSESLVADLLKENGMGKLRVIEASRLNFASYEAVKLMARSLNNLVEVRKRSS